MRMRDVRAVGLLLAVFAGCGDGTGEDLGPGPGPADGSGPALVLTTSNFMSGALATYDLRTGTATSNIDTVDQDAALAVFGGKVYVLDRGSGTGRIYDPQQRFRNPREFSVGNAALPQAQANPHGLHVDVAAQRAYVTLYGGLGASIGAAQALGVIELGSARPEIARFIPLQKAAADPDGNVEADRIVRCGDRLYVTLQDLDRTSGYRAAAPGRIAVVDLGTAPEQVTYIQLAGRNPVALRLLGSDCGEALVADADYQYGTMADALSDGGGVERVSLREGRSLGMVVTAKALGGNVSALDVGGDGRVFVDLIVRRASGDSWDHEVYALDPATRQKGARLLGPMAFAADVRVFGGTLFVAATGVPEARQLSSGLYLGPASGAPLPLTPVQLSLPPYSLGALGL